ncbi:MAG: hypothetical protein FJ382_10595 [Verrucomicrobia bacterium]|nr:hypothetical protein [Verrucomicrobiota bacterium]
MDSPASPFLRIERDAEGTQSVHTVLHLRDPKFLMEFAPDRESPNKVGRGVLKRVCVPNSWAGDYGRYSAFIAEAQEFFARSFGEPVTKAVTRRFGR